MADPRLRRARGALLVSFLVQGASFAVLVTRIPALQRQYGLSDAMLTVVLAVVPVVAGIGSVAAEALAKRFGLKLVLRCVQPAVCLALVPVGAGSAFWQLAAALIVFGLGLGAVEATANMQGVGLQQRYGRSIMLGFHAAFSLGGIAGASLAWAGAHWEVPLSALYAGTACVAVPSALTASRWYWTAAPAPGTAPGTAPASAAPAPAPASGSGGAPAPGTPGTALSPGGAGPPVSASWPRAAWRALLPLCAVMAVVYIADSTVANWGAKYLQDVLGGSEQIATVPYNAFLVATLAGRAFGDLGVRRFGPAATVRAGTLLSAGGLAVVAVAGGAWTGLAGFTAVGLGLCVIAPQTFAAAGRIFAATGAPGSVDAAVARLNIFNYAGVLIGSPLVGVIGDAWSYRAAMLVPMALLLLVLALGRPFTGRRPGAIALRV